MDMADIWVLEGRLHTAHAPAIQTALAAAFPLNRDLEEEGHVVVTDAAVEIFWRTAAPMTLDELVCTLQAAAPETTGTLTVRYPYADETAPVFLMFGPGGVAAHEAYWAMVPEPFRRWPAMEFDHALSRP